MRAFKVTFRTAFNREPRAMQYAIGSVLVTESDFMFGVSHTYLSNAMLRECVRAITPARPASLETSGGQEAEGLATLSGQLHHQLLIRAFRTVVDFIALRGRYEISTDPATGIEAWIEELSPSFANALVDARDLAA